MTYRSFRFVAIVFSALFAVACSNGETVRSGDGPTPAEFFSESDQSNDTPTSELPAPTEHAETTTTTTEAATEPSTSPMLSAVGEVAIPDGEEGELSVVLTGPANRGSLPVIVRNRTAQTLHALEVNGTARAPDGSLAGSGSSQGLTPTIVGPGEWAFGYVYFGFDDLEPDTTFDLTATGRTDSRFIGSVDVLPVELNQIEGSYSRQIVGIVENQSGEDLSGPISVGAACFDPTGTGLWSTHRSFTDGDSLPVGSTASFSIDLFTEDCPVYVVGSSGWSW